MTQRTRSAGFSRVELLVTLSVILLLLANVAPAVMQARTTALQKRCLNNLKQLGLALHNYHDVYNSFPPGFVMRNSESTTQQGFGWQCSILPFVDQSQLYNNLYGSGGGLNGGGLQEAAANSAGEKILQTSIPTYRCPADVTPELNPFRGGWATSNYSGNAGHLPFPRLLGGIASDYWPGAVPTPFAARSKSERMTGLFQVNSRIGIRDIVDGTSNTIMVGERGITSLSGIWPGVTAGMHENDALTDTSHVSRPNQGWTSFSSSHPSGFNVVLADGSARMIDDSIDSQPNLDTSKPLGVYQRIGSRDDGQVVDF